jgi:hypothetical protein
MVQIYQPVWDAHATSFIWWTARPNAVTFDTWIILTFIAHREQVLLGDTVSLSPKTMKSACCIIFIRTARSLFKEMQHFFYEMYAEIQMDIHCLYFDWKILYYVGRNLKCYVFTALSNGVRPSVLRQWNRPCRMYPPTSCQILCVESLWKEGRLLCGSIISTND